MSTIPGDTVRTDADVAQHDALTDTLPADTSRDCPPLLDGAPRGQKV